MKVETAVHAVDDATVSFAVTPLQQRWHRR